ncbi:hypothetical protein [Mycobacterium intracellulare]|uniref:hypothetical protein n=1 Tax=Mycobacterium intracellulare TaxID=1767 RepID=UPI0013E03021|nr:hypothetical protein [Mycobacterium intracellulare]
MLLINVSSDAEAEERSRSLTLELLAGGRRGADVCCASHGGGSVSGAVDWQEWCRSASAHEVEDRAV